MGVTPAKFGPGDRIRVRAYGQHGHVRTPGYVRGKTGRIERYLGAFKNPESLAYGGSGLPEKPLYKVGFRQSDLWAGYSGRSQDALYVDLYEHWLEPARKETL